MFKAISLVLLSAFSVSSMNLAAAWAAPSESAEQVLLEKLVALQGADVTTSESTAAVQSAILAYASTASKQDIGAMVENFTVAAHQMHIDSAAFREGMKLAESRLLQLQGQDAKALPRFVRELSSDLASVKTARGAQFDACDVADQAYVLGTASAIVTMVYGVATSTNVEVPFFASIGVALGGYTVGKGICK